MNLPFQRIHDPLSSYGRLIFPIFWKKKTSNNKMVWLSYFDNYGFRSTDPHFGFHNCTITRIY